MVPVTPGRLLASIQLKQLSNRLANPQALLGDFFYVYGVEETSSDFGLPGSALAGNRHREARGLDDQAVLDIIRRQRHNFMNHLQVLYGYAQLNRIDAMGDYFNRLVQNLIQQSQLNRLADPSLAISLLKWCVVAEDEGIDLKVETAPQLSALKLACSDDLVDLDRRLELAIKAASERPEEERRLAIQVGLDHGHLSALIYEEEIGHGRP